MDSVNNIDPQRIRVNRDHNRADVVGKVVRFDTRDPRGLVADIRIAATSRGDDTLGLAAEDMLSASVGFGINSRTGQILDRARRVRRITNAFLDHIALTMAPAYAGAEVLAVRSATPALDGYLNDPVVVWAEMRCDPVMRWADRRLGKRRTC
jgi:HK97 family phage prohead protease